MATSDIRFTRGHALTSAVILCALILTAAEATAFTENWEQGQRNWSAENGVWEVGSPTAGPGDCHQGGSCAGTVLHGNYPFTHSRLISPPIRLDDVSGGNPFLFMDFWHWFAWGNATGGNPGQGWVQISVFDAGSQSFGTWTDVTDRFSSASGAWTPAQANLTPYAGELVRIAFFHAGANAFSSRSGWYLDKIQIPGSAIGFSFDDFEDWEGSLGGWSADNGVWEFGTPAAGPGGCHQGDRCAGTVLDGNYPFSHSRLISPPVRLSDVTPANPFLHLRFWHWFAWGNATGGNPGQGWIQISVFDSGSSEFSAWQDVSPRMSSSSGAWTRTAVDLTAYAGELVRIGFFHAGANAFSSGAGWYVDEIEISGTADGGEIKYVIEEPTCAGSGGVSNVRGIVYTTEPGAEIERLVEVVFDEGTRSESKIDVPCCSSRGDAPVLLSGFSGIFNWCLLSPGKHTATFIFTSSTGATLRVMKEFLSYCEHPGDTFLSQEEFDWAPGGTCEAEDGGAIICEPAASICNGDVRYEWSQANQSLVLRSNCVNDGFNPPAPPACSDAADEEFGGVLD